MTRLWQLINSLLNLSVQPLGNAAWDLARRFQGPLIYLPNHSNWRDAFVVIRTLQELHFPLPLTIAGAHLNRWPFNLLFKSLNIHCLPSPTLWHLEGQQAHSALKTCLLQSIESHGSILIFIDGKRVPVGYLNAPRFGCLTEILTDLGLSSLCSRAACFLPIQIHYPDNLSHPCTSHLAQLKAVLRQVTDREASVITVRAVSPFVYGVDSLYRTRDLAKNLAVKVKRSFEAEKKLTTSELWKSCQLLARVLRLKFDENVTLSVEQALFFAWTALLDSRAPRRLEATHLSRLENYTKIERQQQIFALQTSLPHLSSLALLGASWLNQRKRSSLENSGNNRYSVADDPAATINEWASFFQREIFEHYIENEVIYRLQQHHLWRHLKQLWDQEGKEGRRKLLYGLKLLRKLFEPLWGAVILAPTHLENIDNLIQMLYLAPDPDLQAVYKPILKKIYACFKRRQKISQMNCSVLLTVCSRVSIQKIMKLNKLPSTEASIL